MLLVWLGCLLAAIAWTFVGFMNLARAQNAPQEASAAAVTAAGYVGLYVLARSCQMIAEAVRDLTAS
jgi:hypothetical protein